LFHTGLFKHFPNNINYLKVNKIGVQGRIT
jgi:hypothetical protein